VKAYSVEISPRTLGYVLLAAAAVWGTFQLANVLIVVTVALILVGTIDPLVAWLERRGFRRGRALAAVFFLLTLALGALLMLMVPAVVSQLFELTTQAPRARDKLIVWLSQYESTTSIANSVRALPVDDLMARAGRTIVGYSTTIIAAIGYAVTTMFLAIYLLAEPVRSKGMLYAVVARNHHIKLARILLELKVIVGGYMRGQLITSASITVFVFVLLSIVDVEHALALAIFAGFTDVIPIVGGLIASAPVIAAVSGSGPGTMAMVTIIMVIYQEFESRILVPRVYGGVLRLSPAIVLVALLIGGTLMGVFGALLALPIAAGVQMLVRELRVDLPGEEPADGTVRAKDEKDEQIYEQLTVGATAADAGVIAGELAEKHKETEQRQLAVTAVMPALGAQV
jgi:predicted PurR-regulated permease PerM